MALVRSINGQRTATTCKGPRTIVDATFIDGSELPNGKMATITVPMFFPATAQANEEIEILCAHEPLAVFGALCTPESEKVNILLGESAYWMSCDSGARADEMKSKAQYLRTQGNIEVISKARDWAPREAIYFKSEPATQTTCAILASVMSQGEPVNKTLFQLNHVRVAEPGCGEEIMAKDTERLFVPVCLLDFTGVVHLRLRKQAALELSGHSSAEEFQTVCREYCLCFPLLSSVRVLVRSKLGGVSEHTFSSQRESPAVETVIVESAIQLWDARSAPNNADVDLSALLQHVPMPSSRMVAARVRDISHASHAGMIVKKHGADIATDYLLVLIAIAEKSGGKQFGTKYRVLTKNVVDCDIWESGTDIPVAADCVSICTMNNLVHYKLAPSRPGTSQYAMALVSNLTPGSETRPASLMIDHVDPVGSSDIEMYKMVLRKLATLAEGALFSTTPTKRSYWSPTRSPWDAKKVRKLAYNATEASLPDTSPGRHG